MTGVKPNTHRRRRRDETVESRRVRVGGVYWALRAQLTGRAEFKPEAAITRASTNPIPEP